MLDFTRTAAARNGEDNISARDTQKLPRTYRGIAVIDHTAVRYEIDCVTVVGVEHLHVRTRGHVATYETETQ